MSESKLLLDEFAYAVPTNVEDQEVPVRRGGLFLYHAALLASAPIHFGEYASKEVVDANGDQLFIPFKLLYGTPHALLKAIDAETQHLMQQAFAQDEPNKPQIRL